MRRGAPAQASPRSGFRYATAPGNDFWLFDGTTVVFNYFTGKGDWAEPGTETSTDPAVAKLCRDAFESVWARATPHEEYKIR